MTGRRVALGTPLSSVLSPKVVKKLALLDLHSVEDLLRHYPRRYDRRGELTPLGRLVPGEQVTVLAEVRSLNWTPMRQRDRWILDVVVTDGRDSLTVTFFNRRSRQTSLRVARRGLFAGKVERFNRTLRLAHPDFRLLDEVGDEETAADFVGELLPIYPAAGELKTWEVTTAVRSVLTRLDTPEDPLPVALRARHGLLDLKEAFEGVHRPGNLDQAGRARRRLRWDEALVLQVALGQRRAERRMLPAVPRVPRPDGLLSAFDARLPFTFTGGQRAVSREIAADLARDHPMYRLLQGEVGSGKTVCALRGILAVVDAGGQAALLAPTEVLAQQHHRSIRELLGPLAEGGMLGGAANGTRVALVTGSQGSAQRRRVLLDVADGTAGIVVGTHALLQDPVDFFDLGLVVVDEQHRFGVLQRDALRAKAAKPPHVLVMTATPIPRTVAMTVFGDLEVSTLRELPHGRLPVQTTVVPVGEHPGWLDRVWTRVREEVGRGRQAFVVCPRIGADDAAGDDAVDDGYGDAGYDASGARQLALDGDGGGRRPPVAVLDVAPGLVEGPLAGLRVAMLHGQLPAEVKDDLMGRFAAGHLDVLVATTVIEVGVDVPNATVMVVLDADRFGISQLHQLRGRIGRGAAPGLCLLVTDASPGTAARHRVDAVAATSDGFELSRLDLEQRREGDVLGASQAGRRSTLRLLRVLRDEEIIRAARDEAGTLVDADPSLSRHPALAAALARMVGSERAEYLDKA